MSRLTKKDISDNYDLTYENGDFVRGIMPNEKVLGEIYINGMNKLGKLEDLEDEINCPLDVVFKALKEGYQYKLITTNIITKEAIEQIIKTDYAYLSYSDDCWWIATIRDCHRLSDYKKTWWLSSDLEE